MSLQTKEIEATIHDVHEFFTDWVTGRCRGDDAMFKKNALDRISEDLVAIMPGGRAFGKKDFAGYMKSIYGSNPAFRIKIRDIRISHQSADLAVVNYHEWQRDAKDSDQPNNGRVTTMVVRDRGYSRGPEILQVHETWLPADVVQSADFAF
ncbi:nuclear transport factor 2 family protein [Mesorhizobium sp. M0482]|uniref:nuclear transport factor 2 family protein n=1 Tax=unclassified Mesorhizobium TaxID=325217 RepID=UPI00333681DF